MGRIVHLDTGYQAVTAAQDLAEIKMGTGQTALVHSVIVMESSEETITDNELLQINCKRLGGSFTSGSGGSTLTVFKNNSADAAHGLATIERNNTTQAVAASGTLEHIPMMCGAMNVNSGEWDRTPIPELRPVLGPGEALVVSLEEVPADSITMRCVVVLEIIAG